MKTTSGTAAPIGTAVGPLVSIVVATRDRATFLGRCLRSILDQSYKNIECIVVDGGSKDESVNILNQLAGSDSRLKFISEPDEGEVYAVNKGIEMSRGEVIGFQASDDFYVLDAVEKSVEFLLSHPEFIGASADARYVDEKGEDLGRGVVTYRGRMARETVKRLIIRRWKMCPVCHGSFFGWRGQMLRHGTFDPNFSVIPDWEYYLRLLKAGEQIGCLPRLHYKYTEHSGMGAIKSWAKVEAQRARLFEIHGITKFDRLLRATVGRLMSYGENPYRTPLLKGLRREIGLWHSQRKGQRPNKPYAPASSGHV